MNENLYDYSEPNPNPLTRMIQIEPTMTPQDMQTINTPSLIMAGEYDLILEDHTRLLDFFERIGY